MREFQILITDQVNGNELDAHTHPSTILKAGIAGEHKASRLVFCLPDSWDSEWTYVVECVNSMGEGTPSEKLSVVEKDGKRTVSFDIPRSMTEMGSSDYVLEAISYDGEEVAKIIRSATVRVGIEKSPTFKKRVVDAIRGIYEELIAKLETIINRFNNGEFNGATFTPSVSAGGDLSWSNDKNLTNPETVNIKGEKGDKGDKGEDGKDGSFSDELADEIAANTAARHTHKNKELLDSLTESMIGTLDVYHELPETANDGEICIYSPANVPTIADSGKLIYVDWDVFNNTINTNYQPSFSISFLDANSNEVGSIYATYIDEQTNYFQYIKGNETWGIYFVDGVFDSENSTYSNDETTVNLTEAPTSFVLPCFSDIEADNDDIKGTVFYAPLRMMVYRDGWYEYTSAATVDVNIGHGYELPENAKEGDLFLYAPQNTLTLADSGKRIYFDWEEFRKPVSEEDDTSLPLWCNFDGGNSLEANAQRSLYGSTLWMQRINLELSITEYLSVTFTEGVLDTEFSEFRVINDVSGEETITHFNSIDELPLYFDIPEFDYIDPNNELTGNAYLFHTEYKLMKYQGGEWVEAVDVPTKTSELENDSGFITNNRIELTAESATLEPNTNYSFGESATLTLEFAEGDAAKVNEYSFTFVSGETPTVLTLPSSVQWANELTVEANKRYEISIVDNIGLWCAVEVSE